MAAIAPALGWSFQVAQFFLVYLGVHGDTVFVRICIIVAEGFLLFWDNTGTKLWRDGFSISGPFHLDFTFWGILIILVTLLPLYAQLTYNDARVRFGGEREDEAEAIWRDWFRRSGMTRADFKLILEAAQWVELPPGADVPMWQSRWAPGAASESASSSDGDGSDSSEGADDAKGCGCRTPAKNGDLYYYLVGGSVDGAAQYAEGSHRFETKAGSFLDTFALTALFGQAHVGLAMQNGAITAKVSGGSSYRPSPPPDAAESAEDLLRRAGGSQQLPLLQPLREGALLLCWRRQDLISRVLEAPCNAANAMRLCVSQACIHDLYERVLQPEFRPRFEAVSGMRRRLNVSKLAPDAASQKRPFWRQWWLSHVSFRDLFHPSPLQRAINDVTMGSQEWSQMESIRQHGLLCLAQTASAFARSEGVGAGELV